MICAIAAVHDAIDADCPVATLAGGAVNRLVAEVQALEKLQLQHATAAHAAQKKKSKQSKTAAAGGSRNSSDSMEVDDGADATSSTDVAEAGGGRKSSMFLKEAPEYVAAGACHS